VIRWRSVRDVVAEALHEVFELADFLIRRADDRWIMPKDPTKETR
jgi:hypothetical protein